MTPEQVRQALSIVQNGGGRCQVAKDLNISKHKAQSLVAAAKALSQMSVSEAIDPKSPVIRSIAVRLLRKGLRINQLAEKLKVTMEIASEVVSDLENSGYLIERRGDRVALSKTASEAAERITLPSTEDTVRLGFVTDTHLCNKKSRLDVLETAYDTFQKEGITTVLHAGNLVDGECRFNRYELLAHGVTDQCKYAIDHYPSRSGIKTMFIDGDDHEGWWQQREGVEFGRLLQLESREAGRDDLEYLGYVEADLLLPTAAGKTVVKVIHPGGGTAYALSYTTQKLVESFQGGEKPDVLLIGHYHKFDYCYPRNVHSLQGGTTEDQTVFMRKKKLDAHVGFSIVEFDRDENGAVTRFTPTLYTFYDRSYYNPKNIESV